MHWVQAAILFKSLQFSILYNEGICVFIRYKHIEHFIQCYSVALDEMLNLFITDARPLPDEYIMSSKHRSLLTIFLIVLVACCCILGACYLIYGLPAPASASQTPPPSASPTPVPQPTAPSLADVPFAIDGHTTILPPQDTDSWDFTKQYGPVSIPDGAKDIVYLTFDKPVASFDDVIALDFTVYGEPFHRILKKTSFSLYDDIITYEGRINTSDPATTFWITFGPGNLVQTDFLWQGSGIELRPIQNRNFTESTTHPLHIACRQPGWDELMQDPEFANDPWVKWINEEHQKYDDDPNYKPESYWEVYLVNSHHTADEPDVTVVRFEETDFQRFPELRELADNPEAKVRLSRNTYDEQTYQQYLVEKFFTFPGQKTVIVEVNGKYYDMSHTVGSVSPWNP